MPDEIIQIEDQYYVLATSTRADDRPRVIKHGESFAVFGSSGAIRPGGLGEQGIYHDGTRFLSRFELVFDGRRLQPLRSTVRNDHVLAVELTNPDYLDLPEPLPRDMLHVGLASFLFEGTWYARIVVHNFSLRPVDIDAQLGFAADFEDIFEVRGIKRSKRGKMRDPRVDGPRVILGYDGLDGVTRSTVLDFGPPPRDVTPSTATWRLSLAPHTEQSLQVTASFVAQSPDVKTPPRAVTSFAPTLDRAREAIAKLWGGGELCASNPSIHEWFQRSACDLRMMLTACQHGVYPYAGVPWFSTVFGRDGIITALETLWIDPSIARGVLAHLAATQATTRDAASDAEPGKILHEARHGEMAALGEVPFARYYGSVDATPLFVMLGGAYYRRTGDRAFIESIWPNVERALDWLDGDADPDRDGFVEYFRRSPTGLISQGWKDSADAVSHRDGTLAEGPIALCEVQAYAYAARRAAAELARVLGDDARAHDLDARAEELRARFDRTFWSDELGTYVLALDGAKRPCKVRASNASHALLAGIATPHRASQLCDSLMGANMFSGWGIRTLDDREARYNPMSYHNGSVWPHDNAMAALGMSRYGFNKRALEVFDAMYRASVSFDLQRMPELFCGFPRTEHEGPTPYPVACAPQSWAAGAAFMLLQACIGLDIDAPRKTIRLVRPVLPETLERVGIHGLRIGDATVDLVVHRAGRHVGVRVERCDGEIEIVVVKHT